MGIEGEGAGQLSRHVEAVDPGGKRLSPEILTAEVLFAGTARRVVVGDGEVRLGLTGDRIGGDTDRSRHRSRGKACH